MIRIGEYVCSKRDNTISGFVHNIHAGIVYFTFKSTTYGYPENYLRVISHVSVPVDEVKTVDFIELADDNWDWMISFIKE